ncbi:hypothetical protein ULMS_27500 [Patiriisocius marinistellae]|uniref:Uncharacterized protein n=1 Tax=Patiriisocius marinistellae TaxID=2494560 RepID=A0A5J4G0W5_9FLAO|nr:hypothetical protein [Patiriisocius marinistellae]GEQ87242.1 hypothetical protein ULMS_27500 [Patiriisocius marinistellae]
MKHLIITCLTLLIFVTTAISQEVMTSTDIEVPESITDNHNFYFPASSNTEWRALSNEIFMAKFDFEGQANRFAYYNINGLRVMYAQLTPIASLPSSIKSKVNNGEDKVNVITLFNPDKTVYKVYNANDANKSSYLDANGKMVSASALPAFMNANK